VLWLKAEIHNHSGLLGGPKFYQAGTLSETISYGRRIDTMLQSLNNDHSVFKSLEEKQLIYMQEWIKF
jgi:hypothetical protein